MKTKERPYGLWSSPFSEEMLAGEARLNDVQWGSDGETVVWHERRDGQGLLKARTGHSGERILVDGLSVRGGVGYGGGEFCVQGDQVFFCADGQLHRVGLTKGLPEKISPAFGNVASPVASSDGQWVAFVHQEGEQDRIAVVAAEGSSWPLIAAQGGDFYMQPAFSPDTSRLAWVRWDHPQMPWNGALIQWASLREEEGTLLVGEPENLAGGTTEAVQQPLFSPSGEKLAYLSDRSGFWQVYVRDLSSGKEQCWSKENQEYGGPAWIQGLRTIAWSNEEEIIAIAAREGIHWLERLTAQGASKIELFGEYTALEQLAIGGDSVAVLGQSSKLPARVICGSLRGDNGKEGRETVVAFSSSERLQDGDLSEVRPVCWPLEKAAQGIEKVYGLFYEPSNQNYHASGLPPAIIMIHGGPTSQRVAKWEARNQYFATRGFAVLDVNYRGSTGYGRPYMEALFGNWGVVDVEDAVGAARFLAHEGLADPNKIVLMGGSAGGYTVLQTLVTHPGVFRAGVCLYGISDLFALQMGTHKFEAHYNDSLIGPLPEAADLFRERSPLFAAQNITDALAIYHGAQDKVVPLDQAEAIVKSLQRRGVPHFYHVYENEGHGWRKEANIKHFHSSLLEFLKKEVVFG